MTSYFLGLAVGVISTILFICCFRFFLGVYSEVPIITAFRVAFIPRFIRNRR